MDFVAQSSNVFIQWGLAAGNFNSTIAQGTGKRVTWNIPANTSNFIDIPVPQSTILSNTFTSFELKTKPLEMEIRTIAFPDNGMGDGKAGFAFDINRATFGAGTTFNNVPNYPYQFNNNVYVNGILEADEIIALSSFTSTNIVNFFSTTLLDADEAFIEYCQVSTLYSTDLIGANEISTFGIENYSQLSQFSFVSTLVVDLQILEGTTGGTTATITKIQANSGGSFVKNYTLGSFSNLSTNTISTGNLYAGQAFLGNPTFSTINLSTIQEIGLTSIYNYPGAITAINTASGTTAPVVAIGFKAQINLNDDTQPRVDYNWNQVTATSNGVNYFPLATFDETLVNPYVWTLSNIATATFSNATIDNAFISTLNLSSVTSENASFSNINISTLNNQNTNTLLQYLATPNSDFATTGSPGVWLTWFDIGQVSSSILSCPSFDINLGTIAMGADNPPNGGMSAYLGVREKGQGNPITYKIFENRTIYAGNPALYGGDVTLALRRGTDYSVNASTLSVWVYGAANNPYFRIGGYASNCFIRGYPY
jgi:hypothetical protein